MSGTTAGQVVIDSSAMVAMLTDGGPAGRWTTSTVTGARLSAPDLMPYEVANILRRHVLAGILDASAATLAHGDLTALPLDLYPYAALADRVWSLRDNVAAYDAAYVATAEMLGVSLITLDAKVARTAGPRCTILTYP